MEDLDLGNVVQRLREARVYRLDRLLNGCLSLLFKFRKLREVRDDILELLRRRRDPELVIKLGEGLITC